MTSEMEMQGRGGRTIEDMRESGILLRARIEGLTAKSRDRTRFIEDEDKIKVQRDAGGKDDTGDKGVWHTWADRVRVWAAWLTDHGLEGHEGVGGIEYRRTNVGAGVRAHLPHAQAGHSHPLLRHLMVGPYKRVEPPFALAPVLLLLLLVKTLLALIAAYPDPTLLVLLFQVEVSGAVPCLGVTTLFLL